ncbi:VCBS domain-containing protein, partial [uncultured Aquimarina sp.]|uniref:VCBS domain-containing protein n=2 Tax=uncultured Aquimarina sp. TaxID=575652 RepID=UPI0026232393
MQKIYKQVSFFFQKLVNGTTDKNCYYKLNNILVIVSCVFLMNPLLLKAQDRVEVYNGPNYHNGSVDTFTNNYYVIEQNNAFGKTIGKKSSFSRSPLDPPVLDLDNLVVGTDFEFNQIPDPGFGYAVGRGVSLTSDNGFVSGATFTVTGNIDANEQIFLFADGGGINFFTFGGTNSATYSFNAGAIVIQLSQVGTNFTISETSNNPIPNNVFEDFILGIFYRNFQDPYSVGSRFIDFTINDTTGGSSMSQTRINIVRFPTQTYAADDSNSILADSTIDITGNLLGNDTPPSGTPALTVTEVDVFPAAVGTTYQTLYGEITINSNGSYTYSVDNNDEAVLGLVNGTSLDDIISYTVEDDDGMFDYGILTITINGVDDPPLAIDDVNSVTVNINNTVTGNVIDGDGTGVGQDLLDRPLSRLIWENEFTDGQAVDGLSRTVDAVMLSFTELDPDGIGAANNLISLNTGTNGGHTGYLLFSIDPPSQPVADTEIIIGFSEQVFNLGFLVTDIDYSQGSFWQDQITIQGSLSGSPVSYQFTRTGGIVEAGSGTFYGIGNAVPSDATGNINVAFDGPIDQLVLSYNYGPDATSADPSAQIAGVSDIFWQGDNGVVVITIDGTPVVGVTTVATTYGFLTINPDGTYTYTVDTTNPAVANLLVGQTLTDTIPYELRDALLSIDDANLIITINGSAVDTDMDGEPDWTDLDDENDGILDENECYVSTVLIGSPDGVEDGSFGVGYWDAEYYSGHFAVVGSTFGNSDQNSTLNGSVGAPTFVGEAFVGGNSLSFTESGSYAQTSPGVFDTNSSTGLVPPSYVGTNIDDVGFQPYYQTIFKREADIDGVLTFGSTGFSVDDTFELFINGTRQVFASFCCGASDSPNDSFSFNVNKGDDLEIRYTNLGFVGSFQFNLELTPSCNTDVDGDGTPNGQDLDSDNDGCNDVVESGGTDTTPADGVLDGTGFDGNGLVTGGTGGYDGVNGNEVVATRLTVSAVPANETVNAGVTVTFSVTANAESTTTYTGTPPATVPNYAIPPATDVSGTIAYQWQRNGTNIDGTIDGGVYSDFNSATLTITNPTTSLSGNTYNVIVTHPDNVCINEQNSATLTVNPSSDLSIAKSAVLTTDADGSTTISAGDTVTFSVTVSNAGANDATGVGVGDTVPDGYTTIGSISNSGSESGGLISWSGLSVTTTTPLVLTYTAVVTATGNYTNFAEITASDNFDPDSTPDGTPDTDAPVEDDETSATPTVALTSDLSIAKSAVLTTDADGSTTISAGDTVTFSVTLSNAGANDATGVGVGDTVPDGYTTIGSISNSGSESGGLISWSGLSVTTTTPLVLTYTAVVTATGNYTNFAEITAS